MSKAQLKKALASMESSEIAEMVCELYDARPEAKEYLEFWLKPDPQGELEKYKVKVHRLFFTPSGKPRKRPTITSLKKELKYFSSICYDSELISELYLYLCSVDIEWLMTRKNPAPSVKSAWGNLDLARQYVEAAGLEDRFAIKLENLEESLKEQERRAEGHRRYGWRRWGW
ncbi:MAG: hypothetical protein K2M69_10190 [Muribaculaceae bacterium]|nr:hypothetical protein [Muribaculaceae bacterium]